MLTFALMVVEWVKANAYISRILEINRKKVKYLRLFIIMNSALTFAPVNLKILHVFLSNISHLGRVGFKKMI